MTIEEKIFKRAKIDFTKLEAFGFQKRQKEWFLARTFMNETFRAEISVDTEGKISGNVYETDSNELYIPLRVEAMSEGFAGQVRKAYEDVLEEMRENCCDSHRFMERQTNRIAQKLTEKYGDKPVFPWEKYQGYGVFKHLKNNKWYVLIGNVEKKKLEKQSEGETEIANIKLPEEKVQNLWHKKGFYPAYHMNKKYWITIVLDDTLSDKEILTLIDESYHLTAPQKENKQRNKK